MKNLLSLYAFLITLTLTAQTTTGFWSLWEDDKYGIRSFNNQASGWYSFAPGYGTLASGDWSTAMGYGTQALGEFSTSLGRETVATGSDSTVLGRETLASGGSSTAMGFQTEASGDYSTAMGYKTTASGQYAIAIGSSGDGQGSAQMVASGYSSVALGGGTKATNNFAIAMGSGSEASGVGSTAMGTSTRATSWQSTAMGWFSKANGEISTAMGYETEADGFNTTAIGSLNTVDENSDPDNWSYSNRAFVIGNGGWDSNGNFTGLRSDALTVLFDGTTTIAGDLNINSDARLKANIISLGSTLAKLLQIDGKSYTMKKDENKKQKIGVLAQDIEKVFAELVSESNGIKSVNYQGLVPVLINALKEQDAMMKKQEKRLERLERLVAAMD